MQKDMGYARKKISMPRSIKKRKKRKKKESSFLKIKDGVMQKRVRVPLKKIHTHAHLDLIV